MIIYEHQHVLEAAVACAREGARNVRVNEPPGSKLRSRPGGRTTAKTARRTSAWVESADAWRPRAIDGGDKW
eukprot:737606-Pleurochrysis_carterae.AAC.1